MTSIQGRSSSRPYESGQAWPSEASSSPSNGDFQNSCLDLRQLPLLPHLDESEAPLCANGDSGGGGKIALREEAAVRLESQLCLVDPLIPVIAEMVRIVLDEENNDAPKTAA